MNKGSAATWASTFQQLAFTSTSTTLSPRTFEDFITKFKESFEHTDIKGNAIAWLSTTQMVKDKKDVFHPSLTDYISSFKNNVALSGITHHNVLIWYFSSSIPHALIRQVYSMDTPPDTITAWYAKAIHFQTQWERADLVARQHNYPTKQFYYHAPLPPKPAKDSNAMDVDVIHITKMTPQEQECCIKNGLCFCCCQSGHLSSACPFFPSDPKKCNPERKVKKVVNKDLPKLEEVEDDDEEETVRRISFTPLDF